MRRVLLVAIVAGFAAIASTVAPGAARAEELPSGRLGILGGVRNGSGRLSSDFGAGGVLGFEAAWQPTETDRFVNLSANVAVMWARFDMTTLGFGGLDDASVTHDLRTVELDAGARVRLAFSPSTRRLLTFGGGVSLLRSNIPLLPDHDRSHIGPYVSAGVDVYASRGVLLGFEVRYGQIATGPGMTSVLLGVALGN